MHTTNMIETDSPSWRVILTVGWHVLRMSLALLAFAAIVAALAIQVPPAGNPFLAVLYVLVSVAVTVPFTQPIVRDIRQPSPATPAVPVPPTPALPDGTRQLR